MARILYAWELGDGLGHTAMLAELARHPQLARHEAIIAMPQLDPSAGYLRERGLRCEQAPYFSAISSMTRSAFSYADILAWHGYADASRLRQMIDAWRALIDNSGADLVIADSAPTLLLAARGRLPVIAAGSPFGMPPDHLPAFPAFAGALADGCRAPMVPEAQLHAALCEVMDGAPPPSTALPGWFAADARVPLVYPLLDPYAGQRREACAGPVHRMPMLEAGDGVFAYLAADYPALDALLAALEKLDAPVRVHVRGTDRAAMPSGRLHWLSAPFDLEGELRRARLVVHHGAFGIAQAAIGSRRAQAVFPFHRENMLNAIALLRAGVAIGAGHAEAARFDAVLQDDAHARSNSARQLSESLSLIAWPGGDAVAAAVTRWLPG